jgi:hypothetical protein
VPHIKPEHFLTYPFQFVIHQLLYLQHYMLWTIHTIRNKINIRTHSYTWNLYLESWAIDFTGCHLIVCRVKRNFFSAVLLADEHCFKPITSAANIPKPICMDLTSHLTVLMRQIQKIGYKTCYVYIFTYHQLADYPHT